MFWHRIWKDNGCPRHGIIYDIKRRTQANYKRVIKTIKREQATLRSDKMACALQCQDKRDLWNEMRRITNNRCNMPNVVDGAQGDDEINTIFRNKYNDLYNSVSFNIHDMKSVQNELDCEIKASCITGSCKSTHDFTIDDVSCAIRRLKPHKADGVEDVSSEILINGCHKLSVHLTMLFNIMLRHGVCPRKMLLSTLVPIPKNRNKSVNDSNNYRAIALGSVVGKVIDNIILEKHRYVLTSSDLQYGFKAKHSTTHCTFVLQEILDYYISNNSSMFLVLLDASRAFDRVQYVKLFLLLRKRNLCPLTCRFLAYMYTNQSLRVNWNGCYSNPFSTSNGVKQGGILSPILFCVYMDELISRLKKSGVGCYIGDMYLGSLGYADDLCLLAPTRGATQIMLNICEKFGREYDVIFNSQKSHLILYNTNYQYIDMPHLQLNGETLHIQRNAYHLGHPIGNDNVNKIACNNAIRDIVWRTNYVMTKFGSCTSDIRSFMFRTYCTSFYGSPLWHLSSPNINGFYVAWRKCVRKIWNVSPRTHCRLVKHLDESNGVQCDLMSRFLSFYDSVSNSNNECTRLCSLLCKLSKSAVAENRRMLLSIFNRSELCEIGKPMLQDYFVCNEICKNEGDLLKELCLIRDKRFFIDFDSREIQLLIDLICTG